MRACPFNLSRLLYVYLCCVPTRPLQAYVESWFEAPMDMDVTFFLRLDSGTATLEWSGNETVAPTEILARTPSHWASGLRRSDHANPAVPPVLLEIWTNPPAFLCSRTDNDIPCVGEMAKWGEASYKHLYASVGEPRHERIIIDTGRC